ncbi:MAG: phosphoribosylglycinamide formyltransferase, partial [Thermodesulfovibrionales bacterium]|nr:phosphoribosylglycinamide formyltransferase [Thermodesulfovibrionales bacterium]
AAVPVYHHDTEETLSGRILKLEHKIYPEAIWLFSEGKLQVDGRIVRITGGVTIDQSFVNPLLKT